MLEFFAAHKREIATLTGEHLWLVGISMLLAIAVGIPLGILLTRRPGWKTAVLGSNSVIQTIPGLALFGLLLPLPWLGARADRLAILRPYALRSAADYRHICRDQRSGGSSSRSRHRHGTHQSTVALASGTSIGGKYNCRGHCVATVFVIGLATIAAAIGAGGLGEFIFRGLAMVNNDVILAGAIPAALMALIADGVLALLQRRLTRASIERGSNEHGPQGFSWRAF